MRVLAGSGEPSAAKLPVPCLRSTTKPVSVVALSTQVRLTWEAVTVAERLADAGFGPVMVMHGGIFRWANEGRPLETPERTHTGVVHPVSPVLGLLLLPDHRARP